MSSDYAQYENTIKILLNKNIRYIGRASNLCWIGFGRDVCVTDLKGNKRYVAEHSIHIQGSFRISQANSIKLSNLEMFVPCNCQESEDDFSWDIQGNNLFDIKSSELTNIFENSIIEVKSVIISPKCDFTINLTDDWCIEIFNNGVSDEEIWRFFSSGKDKEHIVAKSDTICLE